MVLSYFNSIEGVDKSNLEVSHNLLSSYNINTAKSVCGNYITLKCIYYKGKKAEN